MRLKRVVSANSDIHPVLHLVSISSAPSPIPSPTGRGLGRGRGTCARSAPLLLALSVALLSGLGCGGKKPEPNSQASVDALVDEGNPPPTRTSPPSSPQVKEAEALLAKGDAAGAKSKFEAALASQPDDARAQLGLGLSEETLGHADAAERAYRRAAEIDPGLAEAHNNLGLLLRDKGDLEGAIAALGRATEADPRLASAQANLALSLEEAGKPEQAGAAYKKAVALAGDDALLHANYGLFLLNQGQVEAAQAQLMGALPKAKGDRATLLAVGNGLRRAQKPDVAVRALREAISAGDGKPTPALLSELSLAQNAAKDDAGAKASLEEALKLEPKYATAHYLLASLLAAEGDYKSAVLHYKRCIDLDPKSDLARRAKDKLTAASEAAKKR
jgi:Tfp pilus assembly protein PilF